MEKENLKLKIVNKEKLLQMKDYIDYLEKNKFELDFTKENLIELKNCIDNLNYIGKNLFSGNSVYIKLESPDGTRLSNLI